LYSAESEGRKLHQVISQLRNARKAQSGDEQSALQELVHLRNLTQTLTQENEALMTSLAEQEELAKLVPDLQNELAHLQREFSRIDVSLNETKRYLAIREKELYDANTAVNVAQSEQRILQQELDYRAQEIRNLKGAISDMESDYKHQLNILRSQAVEAEKGKEALTQTLAQQAENINQSKLHEMEQKYLKLKQDYDDQELMKRQFELEFNKEKKRMQGAVEEAVRQLQNSSQDVIDRPLIANLIVSYFQRKRSKEVLNLIAKVLSFEEDQLIAVGLKASPINLFVSLLSTVIGQPALEPVPVEVGFSIIVMH
jgi:chromosome segregation ATPase